MPIVQFAWKDLIMDMKSCLVAPICITGETVQCPSDTFQDLAFNHLKSFKRQMSVVVQYAGAPYRELFLCYK